MNQILDYNPNKGNKSSSGSDKIIRVFAIILIIFALCLVASGVYRMYIRNQENNSNANTIQTEKAQIYVDKLDNSVNISVVHTKAIEKLIYSWNDGTETVVKGTGEKTLEKEIQIPAGTNVLHIKVTDVDGNETTYEEEIVAENGTDILNPVITLSVTEQRKLKISVTDETALDFVTYRWDTEEEIKVEPTEEDKKKIEIEIDILKGTHDITIIAVDSSNNTTTETKSYTGLTKPEIKLTLSADKTKVSIDITHENGIKGITGSLNGQDFNVDGIEQDTKNANFELNLVEGTNHIKVVASSVDGTEATAEQEFTYGVEGTNIINNNTVTDANTANNTNTTNTNTTNSTGNNVSDNSTSNKPRVTVEQKADNNKKLYVEIAYDKGVQSATLQFNGQNYDINVGDNMTDGNFELDLVAGENKITLTVVGKDGATQVVEKTFTVQ